jgi:hypothetical protein
MRRRQLLGGAFGLAVVTACNRSTMQAEENPMSGGAPEKVHLIPDGDRIINVGHLADGRMYFVDGQLEWTPPAATKDFVCTFLFDRDGRLSSHTIELIGARGSYAYDAVNAAMNRHLVALGEHSPGDIWVRPFSVQSNGTNFGLVSRQTECGEWRVTFMPGNTLEFYPPWDEGGYDT